MHQGVKGNPHGLTKVYYKKCGSVIIRNNVAVKTNDPLDWSRYKTLTNDVNNLTRQIKADYFKSKLSNLQQPNFKRVMESNQ